MPDPFEWTERLCTLDDRAFVNGLVRETIFPLVSAFETPDPAPLEERFTRLYARHVLLLDGDTPFGFYWVERKTDVLHIRRLFLAASHRSRGIGGRLMRRFEAMGAGALRLEVWENNPACAFYECLGYQAVATHGHKIVMQKTL